MEGPVIPDLTAGFILDQPAELRDAGLVETYRGELRHDLLEDKARFEDLVERRAHPVEVEHRRIDDGINRRLGDHEPTAWPPAHARHLLVLHQPDGFTEHRPADAVALDELGLRPQHLADGPATLDDIGDDVARHGRRQFGAGPLRGAWGCG